MRIEATKMLGKDLKTGDLFSTADQAYWDNIKNNYFMSEKVYIRTEYPCPKDAEEEEIYKIEIIQ